MPFYLGAFLAVALDWRAQAKNAGLHTQALQALEARVAALEDEKKALGRQNEAYQASLKLAQEANEEAEKQLGEAMEFQADFYAREVTLQVQITGLQDMAEASEELQKDSKDQCCGQTEKLERMEGEMASQAKALGLLQVDHDKLQIEVSRLRVEKEAMEKQVASGDATIEELEKAKKTLIDDMAGTFDEGFKEALAQAVCENPGIDVSNCDSTHYVVDGKVSCNLMIAEIDHSRLEDAMDAELRGARKEASDLRQKLHLQAQERIELESKLVPYRLKVMRIQ